MTHRRLASATAGILIAALTFAVSGAGAAVRDAGTSRMGVSTKRGIAHISSGPSSTTAAASVLVYSFGAVGSRVTFVRREHDTPSLVVGIPGSIVQIATSNSDSYALTSSGGVWAWGAGRDGELGDGARSRFVGAPVRVDFPAGVKITSLPNPMPFDAGLAIDSRGKVWVWGHSAQGDLCLPTRRPVLRPIELPLNNVTLATGADDHSLFDSDGTVFACGWGESGELGDGSTLDRSTPTPVVGLPAGQVESLTSSWAGSGALMSDGSYYDWGLNNEGQLGDGGNVNRSLPVRVSLPAPAIDVSQGGSVLDNGQTLAILANGAVWAWGSGQWGQLGDGTVQSSPVPVSVRLPAGVAFTQVSSGGYACYAIDTSGRLWVWGSDEFGQLGDGDRVPMQLTPVPIDLSLTQVSSTASNVAGFYGS